MMATSMSSAERPYRFGDRPIESEDQDTIGRRGFAAQIRAEIEYAPRDQGLVVGVTGPWGCGKTSVINLAVNPLAKRDGYRVIRLTHGCSRARHSLLSNSSRSSGHSSRQEATAQQPSATHSSATARCSTQSDLCRSTTSSRPWQVVSGRPCKRSPRALSRSGRNYPG